MKKLISTLIFTMLLFSCLVCTVSADTPATISEDYQTLFVEDTYYSRVNLSLIEYEYTTLMTDKITLSPTQQETIKEIELQTNDSHSIINVQITFYDDALLSIFFLQNDYLDTYEQLMSGQATEYLIDFVWPEGNIVRADRETLFGEVVTLSKTELEWCDRDFVSAQSDDGALSITTGALLSDKDAYYYVDFSEIHIDNKWDFQTNKYHVLNVHKITDNKLLENITAAQEKLYDDDLGFLYDDDFTEALSTVFMIFIFAIVPFILFVLFLILSIRSKTIYKKFFRIVYILSAAELVAFTIAAMCLIMHG